MQQQDLEIFAPPQGTKSQHNVPFAQPDRGASALQEKLTGTKRCARAPQRMPTRAELLSIYPRQTWTWCKRRLGGRRHLFRMGGVRAASRRIDRITCHMRSLMKTERRTNDSSIQHRGHLPACVEFWAAFIIQMRRRTGQRCLLCRERSGIVVPIGRDVWW